MKLPRKNTGTLLTSLKVGESVIVKDDFGYPWNTTVTETPWCLAHGEWMVGLDKFGGHDGSGGYALSRVSRIEDTAEQTLPHPSFREESLKQEAIDKARKALVDHIASLSRENEKLRLLIKSLYGWQAGEVTEPLPRDIDAEIESVLGRKTMDEIVVFAMTKMDNLT